MGACLSCLPHRCFDDDNHQRASDGSSLSGWQRRCRRFIFFPSCCGMYDALFPSAEEQDATSTHTRPLLQNTGHLDGVSAANSVSPAHNVHANTRNVDRPSNLLRHDKMCANHLQMQTGETQYRNGSGSGWHREAPVIERPKANDYYEDQKLRDEASKLPPSNKNAKVDAITSLLDDEDICPTCLDGYDKDNPKIITKCGHHFHLACIFEWMERSNRCPLCDQEMIFSESS